MAMGSGGASAAGTVFDALAGSGMYTSGSGIRGRGSYDDDDDDAEMNNLFSGGTSPTGHMGIQSEHGNLIITNTEKVCDIYGNDFINGTSGAVKPFQSFNMDINPGNFLTFPELSQEAQNWKEYEMIQCVFIFESTIPDTFTTTDTQFGRVLMTTEQDSKARLPFTADQMEANENVTVGTIGSIGNKTSLHGVECDPAKMPVNKALKYVRTRNEEDTSDYDLGRFQFGVFGTGEQFANEIVGTLKVYYKVCLKTTRLYSYFGLGIPESQFSNTTMIPDTLEKRANEESGEGKLTATQIRTLWHDFHKHSDRMSYNNIPVEIATPKPTDGWDTSPFKSTEFGSDSKQSWGVAMTEQAPGLGLGFRSASLVMSPVVVTFPSNLRGDYEVCFRVEGNYLPPYLLDVASTRNESTPNFYAGNITGGHADPVAYDMGNAGVLRNLSNYVFKPQCLGNVLFNKDMTCAQPATASSLSAGVDTTSYANLGAGADISLVGGEQTLTWTGWPLQLEPEADANHGYEGHAPANFQQGYYRVVMTPSYVEVTVHVHLSVAVSNLGDNRLLCFVPVTMTEAVNGQSSNEAVVPSAVQRDLRIEQNTTAITQRAFSMRQYNSQGKVLDEGKPYLDTRGLTALQYAPIA